MSGKSLVFVRCIKTNGLLMIPVCEIITVYQSAYLPSHSTVRAMHMLIMEILDGVNEGCINGVCLFNLEKCFDTIDLLFYYMAYGTLNTSGFRTTQEETSNVHQR